MPNNRITENSYRKHNKQKLQILEENKHANILGIYNTNLTELILKPPLMDLNVFTY